MTEGLEFPAGIAFDSAGTMYVTERPGRVRVVRDGRLVPRPLAEISTTTSGEAGLLGIAVAPDERSLYVFATAPDGATNRVLRVPIGGGAPETVVEGLPASVYHNGGGVAFDHDGMLLVSIGEQHDAGRAQDPGALGGKVLRLTPDGDVPPDNPFGRSAALALGLRNPYGLAVDPLSGDAFVTENGPESFDEVNRIVARGNYGWPVVSGPAGDAAVTDLPGSYHEPLLSYEDIVVPTGIAFADPDEARTGYADDLFFATFGEQAIHRVRLNGARDEATSDDVLVSSGEPVIALAWGPRGLYYSTPGAVSVIPLARATEPTASPTPRDAPEDEAAPAPPVADEPERSPAGIAIQVIVGALLLGGALVLILRLRRGGGR